MLPQDTALAYDALAQWWQDQHQYSAYGQAALARAVQFVTSKKRAIEIGCGSSGRMIQWLLEAGFVVEGLDISQEMIKLAQRLHPNVVFDCQDVCQWYPRQKYDLIVAWDSTFHLPLAAQEPVLRTLCQGLEPLGILLFTCGGGANASEVEGHFQGQTFAYSTLGINRTLAVLAQEECTCLHLEYDQYPENHVYVISQKLKSPAGSS